MTPVVRTVVGGVLALVPALLTGVWIGSAKARLGDAESEAAGEDKPAVAIAAAADEQYCNANLKKVLRRVLLSCGLAGGEGRGCQPVDAKNVATMAGEDFNALFLPLAERASIIQFDRNKAELDEKDLQLLDKTFADQKGASWFFVVSRASPEGSVEANRTVSQKRAEAVMDHLRQTFNDPDLEREVGLLWLGEEFAQLDEGFCAWHRSGEKDECKPEHLNRSAFVAWIDCRL
jgi:outer membrane protein OmpA-like peptidoglycan-associated protein